MSKKQIPTPEEVLERVLTERVNTVSNLSEKVKLSYVRIMLHPRPQDGNCDFIEAMKEYAKETIKYTLEQAAENAKTITLAPAFGNLKSTVKVNKESILSLEQQIIKDLGISLMKKKLKLHTLPTDNATQLLSCYHRYPDAQYWLFDEHMGKNFVLDNIVFHHLYLTSDEEIKKGDKFIALSVNEVRTALAINGTQIIDEMKSSINKAHARKIVATDNPKLLWKKEVYNMSGLRESGIDWRTKIHNIPTSLIEYFVEKQGKVDEVEVDYENIYTETVENKFHDVDITSTLLLNSSGEIIWSPVEDIIS